RTGERMPPDDALGKSKDFADAADFILEELTKGLDEVEAQFGGKATDVVVKLDVCRRASVAVAGFDDVGIERALGEEAGPLYGSSFALEGFDEFAADNLALLLGVADTLEVSKKLLSSIVDAQVDLEMVGEGGLDKLALIFAQQAIVHEDADELVGD